MRLIVISMTLAASLASILLYALFATDSQESEFAADQYHGKLTATVNYAAIESPRFSKDSDIIAADQQVIGVIVDEQAFAFPTAYMANATNHIVSFAHQGIELAVTHCNISQCNRVLTTNQQFPQIKPATIHVGGLETDGEMVIMVDNTRYSHLSPNVPLNDYEFEVTSRSQWQIQHPDSLYYTGESTAAASKRW